MPNPSKDKKLKGLAEWFGVFNDPTRLMLMVCLSEERMTVTDLAKATDTEIVNISHHLGVMRQAGVVDCEKDVLTMTHKDTGVTVNISLSA